MNIFFISDLHLGHKNILKFSPDRGGKTIEEHSQWLVEQWNSVVRPNDIVWVLGDVCFDEDHMHYLDAMNGYKNLIMGNHDEFPVYLYEKYFEYIGAFKRKYKFWMSHAPIHPNHLREIPNVHGHLHNNYVKKPSILPEYAQNWSRDQRDRRYLNVSVEQNNGIPLSLEEVRSYFKI